MGNYETERDHRDMDIMAAVNGLKVKYSELSNENILLYGHFNNLPLVRVISLFDIFNLQLQIEYKSIIRVPI